MFSGSGCIWKESSLAARTSAPSPCRERTLPKYQFGIPDSYEEGQQITIHSRRPEYPRDPEESRTTSRSFDQDSEALGEYLEKERSSFPRFYFVGDEDLLEIIGNSKDIRRVMKHLKKMFAGISTLQLDEEDTQLLGFSSREGEEVSFRAPIMLKDYPKINDWLARVETEMRLSLAVLLSQSVQELRKLFSVDVDLSLPNLLAWIDLYPAQLVVLAFQIAWTDLVETAFAGKGLDGALGLVTKTLDLLADTVLQDIAPLQRQKCEHLITELVHQRDVIRSLISSEVRQSSNFEWLYHMRFYINEAVGDPLLRLEVRMADAVFPYGYEYLGVPDRLVQTPLTDRCYLTLTQALNNQLGGSPFGPAGTGKPSLSSRWESSLDASSWCSAVTRLSTSKLWVGSLSVYVKLVLGVALTSSIDWKRGSCPLSLSKSKASSKV